MLYLLSGAVPSVGRGTGVSLSTNLVFTVLLYNTGTMSFNITSQINTELGGLGPDEQQRVLDYVRSLRRIGMGMSADALMKHVGCIDSSDGEAMRDAIETGCEQVNMDEW